VKRTTLILLTAFYLLSCVGMSINRFYCCGKLASVTVSYGAGDNANHNAADKNQCCRHEKQNLKVNDGHFSVVPSTLNHPLAQIIPHFVSLNNDAVVSLLHTRIVYKGNAPPGHSIIPAYALNCTYRI
jgi:hypothetical protein